MIQTVMPVPELLPPNFAPFGSGVDPEVGTGRPVSPLPPYHPPTAPTVDQAEFDALEARVTALEATP